MLSVASGPENAAVAMPEVVATQRMIAAVVTSLRIDVNGESRESIRAQQVAVFLPDCSARLMWQVYLAWFLAL